MKNVRLAVVDDHEVVRAGLCSLFAQVPGLNVVGDVGSGEEALALVARKLPDVVVMDVRMPGMDGIEACRIIRAKYPQVKVIMLTSYSDDVALVASLLAGASGFVLKDVDCSELIEGTRVVAAGGTLVDPFLAEGVLQRLRGDTDLGVDSVEEAELTERERRILALIAGGQTNKEIATRLNLSEKTVRNYVSSLLAKLKVSNRAEAAAHAVRENLVG